MKSNKEKEMKIKDKGNAPIIVKLGGEIEIFEVTLPNDKSFKELKETINKKIDEARKLSNIKSINDKAGYKAVNDARLDLKSIRLEITKEAKYITETPKKIIKIVNDRKKELLGPIEVIEKVLLGRTAEIDSIISLEQRKEKLSSINVDFDEDEVKKMTEAQFKRYYDRLLIEAKEKEMEEIRQMKKEIFLKKVMLINDEAELSKINTETDDEKLLVEERRNSIRKQKELEEKRLQEQKELEEKRLQEQKELEEKNNLKIFSLELETITNLEDLNKVKINSDKEGVLVEERRDKILILIENKIQEAENKIVKDLEEIKTLEDIKIYIKGIQKNKLSERMQNLIQDKIFKLAEEKKEKEKALKANEKIQLWLKENNFNKETDEMITLEDKIILKRVVSIFKK